METDKTIICPECGNPHLFHDPESGELICERCGLVVSSKSFDYGPEWRAFNQEQKENRNRVGAPLTSAIHDRGLSTVIDWRGRDAKGRRLNSERRAQAYRLRKWNRRSKVADTIKRNLSRAFSEMTKASYNLNLPKNVLETASMIYRRAVKKNCVKGRSINEVAAASLYMACRKCEVIRTLEEVGKSMNLSANKCGRVYRFLLRRLNADVPLYGLEGYLSKFVSQLSLSGETEILADEILSMAAELRLTSGRGPSGMAAAATYIACRLNGDHVTQGTIARIADVTEVTIRNRYKELVQEIGIEVEL